MTSPVSPRLVILGKVFSLLPCSKAADACLQMTGEDPASTGKYGQGFNSCFHWTDGPWVLSRQWLLFLDPHRGWSREGGPTYDFVENRNSLELKNHLETFNSAKVDTSNAVSGTVIRIPLRTEAQAPKSKIVNREISTEEITKALHELGQEIKDGGMLFLRHIRKVTAKIDDTILWQAHVAGATDEDTQYDCLHILSPLDLVLTRVGLCKVSPGLSKTCMPVCL